MSIGNTASFPVASLAARAADGQPGLHSFGSWVGRSLRGLVLMLWHTPPQRLAVYAVVAVVAGVAARAVMLEARRRLRARSAAGGYLVKVTPPRTVDVSRSGEVWRLLHSLAKRAGAGWLKSKPPMSVEVHAEGGRLSWCVWVPGAVPLTAVVADVAQAWPGASVKLWQSEPASQDARAAAGSRLAVQASQHTSVVRDTRMASGDDVLRAVLSGLAQVQHTAVLQVMVRPAKGKRVKALRRAARGLPPAKPLWHQAILGTANLTAGAVREVSSIAFSSSSSSTPGATHGPRSYGPDPLQREQMREAAVKLADTPLWEAAIRVTVLADTRSAAKQAAKAIADGYAVAGGDLVGVRLSRPLSAVRDRWVRPREWLLLGSQELAVLAHLPADPAYYGFETAALHRPYPKGARLAEPEKPRPDASGWLPKSGWTSPRHNPGPATSSLRVPRSNPVHTTINPTQREKKQMTPAIPFPELIEQHGSAVDAYWALLDAEHDRGTTNEESST